MLNLLAAADAKTIIIFVVAGVLIVGMFVFNMLTSKKQRKAEEDRLKNLKIGDKVLMSCGIQGTIVEINEISPVDTNVVIRTGSEDEPCTLTFDVRAVYRTLDDKASDTAVESETNEEKPEEKGEKKTEASESANDVQDDK
ncbi:MAG: preprotein translocase subunit YajC [Firmicutes bacterium]|nr:preprotein translocase subunit YajC [Bacillota bacterium]